MSIEALSREVLTKAHSHKEELDNEYKNQISLIDKEFEDMFLNLKEKLEKTHQKSLEIEKIKILGEAKKDAKQYLLHTKSDLVKEVYNKTLEDLKTLEIKENQTFLLKIIRKVKDSGFDFEIIYCRKEDFDFVKKSLPKKTIKTKNNFSGLIFETKSRDEVLDMSFEEILKETFEENEDKVLSLLFNS